LGFSSGVIDSGNHGDGTTRTLGSQSGVAADGIELEHAYGTGASNNTPNAGTPFNVYIGRIVILRPDTATQEYGLIVSTSTSTRMQIDHDWIIGPTSGDAYIVCYRMADDSGGSISQVSSAPDFWVSNGDFDVNSTGALCITESTRWIDKDNGAATTESLTVQDDAYFVCGARSRDNVGISGGAMMAEAGNPNSRNGDEYLEAQVGSFCCLNGGSIVGMRDCNIQLIGGTANGAGGEITDFSFKGATWEMLIKGNYDILNMKFIGQGNTEDWMEIDDNVTIDGLFMLSCAGIRSEPDTTDQTLTVLNPVFLDMSETLRVENNKKFLIVNPIGLVHNSTQVNFITATNNPQVDELWRQLVTVRTGTTARVGYSVYGYEELLNNDLNHVAQTDSSGIAIMDLIYETDTFPASVFTNVSRGTYTVKGIDYGFDEFVRTITDKTASVLPIDVQVDAFKVQATEATARTGNSGFTVASVLDAAALNQSHSIIKLTSIAVQPVEVGDTITGVTSTADGVVEEIIEGDGTIGVDSTVILITRDTNAFTPAGESTTHDGGGTASFVAASEFRFFRLIRAGLFGTADPRNPQELYDHLVAKLAEDPISTTDFDDIMGRWGEDEYVNPMFGFAIGSPNGFKTRRNVSRTEGVVISGLDTLSGISAFTSNDGTEFIPATLVTVTITVVEQEDFVTAVVGARVGTHRQSDNSEVDNQTTNGSGIVTFTIPLSVDLDVFLRIRQATEEYPKIPATIDSVTGLTLTVPVKDDPQYTPT